MVLSADIQSVLRNVGVLDDGLEPAEVKKRIQEERSQMQVRSFPARTSNGVRLGMSESQVRRLLGKPQITMWSKKFQAREFIFSRNTRKSKEGLSTRYSNYYLFRGDRLYMIELRADTIGGA